MKISSKDNPVVKYLVKLYESKKERDLSGAFIVEGYHLVEEAKNASLLERVYSIKQEKDYPDAVEITPEILKKVTDTVSPEGIIGVCKKRKSAEIGDRILYLDRVQDPGNIGTLLRSALAFGFDTIVMDETVDPYNPKVLRSSQGSIFSLSIIKKPLTELKEEGYKILGTSMHGFNLDGYNEKPEKVCIILGNEGYGVRDEYLSFSDINLTIPMIKMESLNVGVAGSILMYKLKK